MTEDIIQSKLTSELKEHIYKLFAQHSISATGFNGLDQEPVAFEIHKDGKVIGCVVVQMFWGQLHIKYLLVDEKYRDRGLARKLMEHAFAYGKRHGCNFVFVETMSFQAPEFYKKLGFRVELKRNGYAGGTSFYYLCKNLN